MARRSARTTSTAGGGRSDRLNRRRHLPHRASTGLAVWDGAEDAAALVARTDADMYEHKRAHALVAG
jgi:hypothetical protein